jgi:hypothetical protein
MTNVLRSWRRALVLVAAVGALLVVASPAQAQEPPDIGASAIKNCPIQTAELGETVTCTFIVANLSSLDGVVTSLTETNPDPGTPVDISCTVVGGTEVISEGDTLAGNTLCAGTVDVTIPDDPALCGTSQTDRVEIALQYNQFDPPLTSGAFATHTFAIICPADISITKTADELSKAGDDVTYTFEICNLGDATVNRDSVNDTLLGDITDSFPPSLAPGECATVVLQRTVLDTDPDPLPNTVTAVYTSGATTDTATASASTELFQPGVSVTKDCTPDPVEVGGVVTCTIVVTNTGSADSPNLINGTIVDTLTGDLLDAANTAVTSSDCTPVLATGGTCTIVTERTVLDTDPNPLVNTVTVHYNPEEFPNDITANASDSVTVKPPPGGEGCTPGFWKQDQHFDSWVGFAPGDFFDAVFGVDVTLRVDNQQVANPTLLQALMAQGGGVNALARHAVAALLNASNPDVSFDFTAAEVIALVQEAVASGDFETAHQLLAAANEQGCPLN